MIEVLTDFPDDVAAAVCSGKVTKADYEEVLLPHIEDKFRRHSKLRIYYEIAPDFDGMDVGAVWDDTKLGFSHLRNWERFAVVTDVDWIKHAVSLFGFLIPGQLRVFPTTDAGTAREWIVAPQQ